MTEPILGTLWEYKGKQYTIAGFPEVKDDTDARWYSGIAYYPAEEGEVLEDLGNLYVRKRNDFMSKFKEVENVD